MTSFGVGFDGAGGGWEVLAFFVGGEGAAVEGEGDLDFCFVC